MDWSNEEEALAPGQWRLAHMAVFNWGTFDGLHEIDVSREGMLITGDSGSGKSTLVDAISAVIAPNAQSSFNAAASSEGKRDKGRNLVNYVRGAFGHASDESGEIGRKFLRERKATWSAIVLTYEDGVDTEGMSPAEALRHAPRSVAALFFLKRNSNSDEGLSRLYASVSGRLPIADLEEFGRNGADVRSFNKAFKDKGRAWSRQSEFLASVRTQFGIQSPSTLRLLQKTQAAKNIGSLDDLFRRYMLEEPSTFSTAEKANEQFSALENAHQGVVNQRRQMDSLAPLEQLNQEFSRREKVKQELDELIDAMPLFAEDVICDFFRDQIQALQARKATLEEQLAVAQSQQRVLQQRFDDAQALLAKQNGSVLDNARLQVDTAQKNLYSVQMQCVELQKKLRRIGIEEVPTDLPSFDALKQRLRQEAEASIAGAEQQREQRELAFATLHNTKEQLEALGEELRHLRASASNIPRHLHQIRVEIARSCGLSLEDLPFVGELIDVKDSQAPWRGAIERLLRQRAQTLLVPKLHVKAVSQFLEGRHLGCRFAYDAVPKNCEVPAVTIAENSLVRKVTVAENRAHPEFSEWVNRLLRKSFNYSCVNSAAQLQEVDYGLTQGGQVKAKNSYVKDDRHAVGDRTHWVLGSRNDQKIASLEESVNMLQLQQNEAAAESQRLEARERRASAIAELAEDLEQRDWELYDLALAEQDVVSAQNYVAELEKDSKFKEAASRRDKARERLDQGTKALEDIRVELRSCSDALVRAQEELGNHVGTREGYIAEGRQMAPATASKLRQRCQHQDRHFPGDAVAVYQVTNRVKDSLLQQRNSEISGQQAVVRKSESIMGEFCRDWPAETANLTSDFADRDAFISRYRQIKATRLPEYESKFLDVLNDFSRDQITTLSNEIYDAFRQVRERLDPVNASLRLSEYNPGTHLRLQVKEVRSTTVREFLGQLREITSGTWAAATPQVAEERYLRTAAVMKRLRSSEPADRRWRQECLDTTHHMHFIAEETDANGDVVNVYGNDEGLSGGQRQKLVFFCLAAALRYQLSDEDRPVPTFGTVVLDEAFDKSDRHFAREVLDIFQAFHFHMVLATPNKMLQAIEDYVGGLALVSADDQGRSHIAPIYFQEGASANGSSVEGDLRP